MDDVILATIEHIPGYRVVKVLGVVTGNTVRARHIGKDIVAFLRSIVGGEIREYSELLESARSVALEKLKEKAKKMGANAVVGIRFSTSSVMAGAAEILAYGTAVVVEKAE